ncbi:MAG: hypothetical protein JWO81_2574 [Alphaproteobacteria bacterium]|nr:hypothetical protein [Alphaproteobacteria bacterium]
MTNDTTPPAAENQPAQTDSPAGPPAAPASPSPAPPPPSPESILREIKLAAVRAELLKPVGAATEDLFSIDPAKYKAREAIKSAYAKAAGTAAAPGKLRLDYKAADAQFRLTAEDMVPRLDAWIAKYLAPGQPVYALLDARLKAGESVDERSGPAELKRDRAAAATRQWASRFADWSAPDKGIEIQTVAEMQKLNGNINNQVDPDYSIYRFWFEIAPKHLGAGDKSVAAGELKSLDKIRAALAPHFPALTGAFDSGADRLDGPVYLLDPGELEAKRAAIRQAWEDAAKAQAEPDVDYQIAPDDTASLKTRRDQLDKQYDASVRAAMPPAANP